MDLKYKIGFIILYIIELILLVSGPKIIAIVLLIITTLAYFLLSENKEVGDDFLKNITDNLNKEIELLKKSSKKIDSNLYDKNINAIETNITSLIEKYNFIIENYGSERGKVSLEKIEEKFKTLESNLKQVNDSLLVLYTSSDLEKDNKIENQLSTIADELNAYISLK